MAQTTPTDALDLSGLIDLDAHRSARRETTTGLPLRLGGQTYVLAPEVPLDVFEPLLAVDVDMALLVRQAMSIANGSNNAQQQRDATALIVDLLVANPNLPRDVISAIVKVAQRMLGEEAYAALVAFRPSKEDAGVLAKALFAHYGVSLGEASAPSEQSEGAGTTSKQTSSGGTA